LRRPQRKKGRKSLAERTAQRPLDAEQRAALEAKMCGEKRRFKFKGDAERLAAEYNLGVYGCQFCGGWHFTSKPPAS
jgi:hypothetical protein